MAGIHLKIVEPVWTDDKIETLKKLWDEGVRTSEIGSRLKVSKNAVIGKVHRLKLTPRPSPLKRAPHRPAVKPTVGAVLACQWPLPSQAAKDRYVSCGKDTLPGKPYCADHAARAYKKSDATVLP